MDLKGSGPTCTTQFPKGTMRQLEAGPGPGNAPLPESALPRACSTLGLGGKIVGHARPGVLLGYAALTRRVSPGRLTQNAWDRQWAIYFAIHHPAGAPGNLGGVLLGPIHAERPAPPQ